MKLSVTRFAIVIADIYEMRRLGALPKNQSGLGKVLLSESTRPVFAFGLFGIVRFFLGAVARKKETCKKFYH